MINGTKPTAAMVLAAGLGKRMRPITDTIPKPLVRIAGKTLLDWGLDTPCRSRRRQGSRQRPPFPRTDRRACAPRRAKPAVVISDESAELLDSGGGIVKALPVLGREPFFILNADTFWIDRGRLESRTAGACMGPVGDGYSAHAGGLAIGDRPQRQDRFRARRRRQACRAPAGLTEGLIYAGAAIVHPRIFAACPGECRIRSTSISTGPSPPAGCSASRWRVSGSPSARRTRSRLPKRLYRRTLAEAMSVPEPPRVFSIPAGVPFLPTLAEALLAGELVPGFAFDGDPLTLADATIFVPTRRAARELRSVVRRAGRRAAPRSCRRSGRSASSTKTSCCSSAGARPRSILRRRSLRIDRLLLLAPLVRAWKSRLPAHVAALFEEEVVVPASAADAIWLARDLAALMDEIETEGSDWARLDALVSGDLAGWWQVTLDFLRIVTAAWPEVLAERQQSNPAAHRSALIRAEAARLARNPPARPGDRRRLDRLYPGDRRTAVGDRAPAERRGGAARPRHALDERCVVACRASKGPVLRARPSRNSALRSCSARSALRRADVEEIGISSLPLAHRSRLVSEALRPAETTDGGPTFVQPSAKPKSTPHWRV